MQREKDKQSETERTIRNSSMGTVLVTKLDDFVCWFNPIWLKDKKDCYTHTPLINVRKP